MNIALCSRLDEIQVSEKPVPQIHAGEILIQVDACGLCGTDIQKLQGKGLRPAATLGHEIVGTICEMGNDVDDFQLGNRVVVAHHVPCFRCHFCRHKNYSMCKDFKTSNVDPGGFAEYVRVPQRHVHCTTFQVPDHLENHKALFTEPLACCLRCINRLSLLDGDTVLLVGFGSIGILMAYLLQEQGIHVLALDLDDKRLRIADALGATSIHPQQENLKRVIQQHTDGRGVDCVLFTAGTKEMLGNSLEWLRDGGSICLFAGLGGAEKAVLDPYELYRREINITSSYSPGPWELKEAFRLIASRKINLNHLPVQTFSLDAIPEAIDQTLRRKILKAVIQPKIKKRAISKSQMKSHVKEEMAAVRFYGVGQLRFETAKTPHPGKGEVLLQVGAALTCGTDFKAFRQGHPVLLNDQVPAPFGHEVAGTLCKLGEGVEGFELGQRVVAANSAPCDECFYCQNGNPNLCENRKLLNGAYAEYLLIPSAIVKHNLYPIDERVPFEVAAMTEPLACVVRAVDQMGLRAGQTLGIYGCGFMGFLFTQLAKNIGAKIIAIGRSKSKLQQAKAFGADEVLSILDHKDPVKAVRERTPTGRGVDVVVEAIGNPETWSQAVRMVRPGGTVCLYGGCAKGSKFELDTHRTHYQELKIIGVFHHTPRHFAQALRLLTEGVIDTDRLLGGSVLLRDLPKHFEQNVDRPFVKCPVMP